MSSMAIGMLIYGFWGDWFYSFTAFFAWMMFCAFLEELLQHNPKG
jgi:hypothetical protein